MSSKNCDFWNFCDFSKNCEKLEKSQFLLLCANLDICDGFPNTYPLDSDLSGGLCYPTFEQPDV